MSVIFEYASILQLVGTDILTEALYLPSGDGTYSPLNYYKENLTFTTTFLVTGNAASLDNNITFVRVGRTVTAVFNNNGGLTVFLNMKKSLIDYQLKLKERKLLVTNGMASEIKDGFLTAEESRRILHVTDETLRHWSKIGKIEFTRAPGANTHRRYNVKKFIHDRDNKQYEPKLSTGMESAPLPIRRRIIYARVSTRGQKENLVRQIDYLRERYPNHELVTDIASGINFKRKGLKTILDFAIKRELEEVVVAYKDRLSRFGFEHFEYLYKQLSNARIVVLDNRETSPDQELAEDVLTIVTVFSAKINGRKRYGKRKKQKDESPDETIENDESPDISFEESEEETE